MFGLLKTYQVLGTDVRILEASVGKQVYYRYRTAHPNEALSDSSFIIIKNTKLSYVLRIFILISSVSKSDSSYSYINLK